MHSKTDPHDVDFDGSPVATVMWFDLERPVRISSEVLAAWQADGPVEWTTRGGVVMVRGRGDAQFVGAARRVLGIEGQAKVIFKDGDNHDLTFQNLGVRTSAGTDHYVAALNPLLTAPWPVLKARERCRPTRHAVFVLPPDDAPDAHEVSGYG